MSSHAASDARPAYAKAADELRDNPGQWQTYESESNCVVLAGPGSGKTKTLTIKLARMAAEDVRPPRKLACITYSNECVLELKRRLKRLGIDERRNVFIGTVHSFCLQNLVLPYAHLAGEPIPRPIAVATEREQQLIFDEAVRDVFGGNENPNNLRIPAHRHRRTVLDRDSGDWNVEYPDYGALIDRYEEALHDRGLVDFDDMALIGRRLILGHDWIRRAIRARFPILAIDEYQDLGAPLHDIVVALLESGTRILAVGDPNQSIYGFTGAQPRLLVSLARRPDVEVARLRFNYRCGKRIVRTSNVTIPRRSGEVSKSAHEGLIDWHECPGGIEEQADYICTTLLKEITSRNPDVTLGDIAVLYPAKYEGDEIAAAAQRAGISFTRVDRNAAYPKTPVTRWLELCASWCSDGWILGDPPLSSLIRSWVRLNRSATSPLAVRKIKSELVRVLVGSRRPSLPLSDWLSAMELAVLRPAFDSEPTLRDEAECFAKLKEAAGPKGPLDGATIERFGAERGAPHYLNLITLHSSKGREFEAVVVMGLDLGRLPRNPDNNDEERRLFYVGLTRAKREFHMTYSGWVSTRRGSRWDRGPSPFLLEIQEQALNSDG